MSDLTSELQQMADDAACQARPLAAADVIRRGDRRHRRSITRLSLGGLSATGVIAAVIVGAIALLSASHQASHQPHAQLAAWTVVKQADGNIYVTIRQLSDPAGLQSTLRADGVPASVTFTGQKNPACQLYPQGAGTGLGREVISVRGEGQSTLTIIDPSALPDGAGVQFASLVTGQGMLAAVQADLVQASSQCTGS
jgi:hypothetical protein